MTHTLETKQKISISRKGKLLGSDHPNWRGGKTIDKAGYILVKMRDHPAANKLGYIREHRVIMEKNIGRFLQQNEEVHHINGIKDDNRIENLEIMTKSDHSKITYQERKKNKRGQLI